LPANRATRFGRYTALSFFAGKRAPTGDHRTCWSEACPRIRRRGLAGIPRYRSPRASALLQAITEPVGAVLARESGAPVWQAYRVIVLRGHPGLAGIPGHRSSRASALLQAITKPVGAVLARELCAPAWQAYRVIVLRGQARSYSRSANLLERGLPANQAPRFGRHTASSIIAGKRVYRINSVLANHADRKDAPLVAVTRLMDMNTKPVSGRCVDTHSHRPNHSIPTPESIKAISTVALLSIVNYRMETPTIALR